MAELNFNIGKQIRPAWQAIRTRGDISVLSAVVRGNLNLRYQAGSNREHLETTMDWLCRAQDATLDSGVSAAYDIVANTWYPSYPETTGYIIPSFLDYAMFSGDDHYRVRALQMAEWLLSLQHENGAFPGPPWIEPTDKPVVFDTGQIIHGLVKAYNETGDLRFLDASVRAGDWLVSIQESDGSWCNYDMEHAHTYNTRTAWALLLIDQANHCDRYRMAAQGNLDWALSQQISDGWFKNASFNPDEHPLTHTIAYTTEGLLEAGKLLPDQRLIEAARLTADALCYQQEQDGYLRGNYRLGWHSDVTWSCLTGNAQMALIWFQLYKITRENKYLIAAKTANKYIKKVQSRSSKSPGIRGGVAGSYPIFGDYGHFLYLNWAAKFFADSLMAEEQIIIQEHRY